MSQKVSVVFIQKVSQKVTDLIVKSWNERHIPYIL